MRFIRRNANKKLFIEKLQTCFDDNYFYMGNEPDIAFPYLFNFVKGEEWYFGSYSKMENGLERLQMGMALELEILYQIIYQ